MNYVIACFAGRSTLSTTEPLWQWDYGQLLIIRGLALPAAFEVHWTDRETGTTTTTIGSTTEGVSAVTVPDIYLESGREITAYIYLHTTETDGETDYKITIPVLERPQPTHETPTPVQQGEIEQIIAALNAEADRAEAAAESAENSASAAQTAAGAAAGSATAAAGSATAAAGSATAAAGSATSAESYASAANLSAQAAGLARDEAVDARNTATQAQQSAQSFAQIALGARIGAEAAAADARDSADEAAEAVSQIEDLREMILGAYPTVTASGNPISITDGADGVPVKAFRVNLPYVQPEQVQAYLAVSGGTYSYMTLGESMRTIITPINGGATYTVQSGIPGTMRLAAFTSRPVAGSSSSTVGVEVARTSSPAVATLVVPTGYRWLAVQFFINADAQQGATIAGALAGYSIDPQPDYSGIIIEQTGGTSRIISIDWSETGAIYGGELDALAGIVYDQYDSTGAPIIPPVEIPVEAVEIVTALGANGFSATDGQITMVYRADTKLYIDRVTGG